MSPSQALAAIIRQRRKTLGLSLPELSRLSGVSLSSVSAYERGDRFPKPPNLAAVARALQTTLDALDPWWQDRAGSESGQAVSDVTAAYATRRPCPPDLEDLCQDWSLLDDSTRQAIITLARLARQQARKSPSAGRDRPQSHTA